MKDYKEFTSAWLIFAFMIPMQILLTYLYVNNIGTRPIGTSAFILISLIFILSCCLFYGMTTKVTSDLLTVSFGIGLIKRKILLSRIKDVEAVKSPWYYGWGIRIIPNGMLYNISGRNGVELTFTDTERIVRIGTKDALKLKSEINRQITKGK